MLNISRCAQTMVVVVWMAGIRCDKPKATSTASTSSPVAKENGSTALSSEQDAQPAASAELPKPAKDAGPPDWYTCKRADECTVVYEDACCLPDCDPLVFKGYTAVNAKHRADFIGHIGCADTECPVCPTPPQGIPRSDSNFFALCQQGRCVAVDLRFSKYSECKTLKDCALRFGLGCCEGCGDKDLVTYNPASTLAAELCPTKPKCPPVAPACLARRHSYQNAECALNHCQLSD
jgi:hypothetical protein